MLASAAAAVMAWMTASSARFMFLQVAAFEVWHAGKLLYSGLESWHPPYIRDVEAMLQELEQRGVAVSKLAKAQACTTQGGSGG
mmetsp:Transcript_30078/g.86142  ORF Transcript_30078/g.86142 Transcript_30078/m.86142 type:complete len:84 (-) Transcript_30078:383-634(-)